MNTFGKQIVKQSLAFLKLVTLLEESRLITAHFIGQSEHNCGIICSLLYGQKTPILRDTVTMNISRCNSQFSYLVANVSAIGFRGKQIIQRVYTRGLIKLNLPWRWLMVGPG